MVFTTIFRALYFLAYRTCTLNTISGVCMVLVALMTVALPVDGQDGASEIKTQTGPAMRTAALGLSVTCCVLPRDQVRRSMSGLWYI